MSLFKKANVYGLAILSMTLLAGYAPAHAENYEKSYTVANRASVRIDTDDGSVNIATGDTKQIEFRVEYEGYVLHKNLEIESNQHGDEVELVAKVPKGLHLSIGLIRRLHIEVRMPKDADLQVRTGDGSVKASNIVGAVDLRSGDGSLTVDALKGAIKLHTGDGAIEASDLDGKCDATSGDGRLRLAGRFDALTAHTGDGNIDVQAAHASKMDSDWKITSGDGGIDVAVPSDLPANIEASSGDGRITSDIPITMDGVMSKSKIHGKMNGGGATLTIHTGDGSIHLKQV
jgi:DUF4097 and DUF4098 domain-containing protein YvlB